MKGRFSKPVKSTFSNFAKTQRATECNYTKKKLDMTVVI